VVRKNKMKKTIKNKKEETNKVPVITFTVAAVGEFIRTRAVQSLLNIFFFRIKFVFLFAVSHCSEFHLSTHSGN